MGPVPVEQLEVLPALPPGFDFVRSVPAAKMVGDQPLFRVAELTPQEELRIRIRLNPTRVGNMQGQARVTFNTSSSTGFHVVEPKLKIGVEGPETAIVGTQAIFNVTVSNPGSGKAENVALNVKLPKGLIRAAKSSKYGLGVLNPGEARTIRIVASVAQLGRLPSTFVATRRPWTSRRSRQGCDRPRREAGRGHRWPRFPLCIAAGLLHRPREE